MSKVIVEVCCNSLDDCINAWKGGADRIELVSCHQASGLTPSIGSLIEAKASVDIPIVAMVRPRAGGFCYTDNEMKTVLKDAELLQKHGADGIVFGFLKQDGTLDVEKCAQLMKVMDKNKETVFHRAFDVVPDPFQTMEQLISLNVTRILTSGHQATAEAGATQIKQLVDKAGTRVQILMGAAIRDHNARKLVEVTGCRQIHFSYNETHYDRSMLGNKNISFNRTDAQEDAYTITSVDGVRKTEEAVKGI